MDNPSYLLNFSYIFIPFCLGQEKHFTLFNSDIINSGKWADINDKISYLHRYVSDRLINTNTNDVNLHRYRLYPDKSSNGDLDLCFDEYCYSTAAKEYKGEKGVSFKFRILDVQLFSFNTSVCILAFKLNFINNDPFYIASAQYYLRKISTEHIQKCNADGSTTSKSFIDISKGILGNLVEEYSLNFFFYAPQKSERANFFTYLDVPKKDDYSKELYHLRWCYNDAFVYSDDTIEDDCINYQADKNKVWGISPSAAVCLVNRDEKTRVFIENVFQKNFQNQYLFTYIFLLHQKYMIYLFLTKITIDIDNDLMLLEDYKRRLYEFETKYIFSQISEVPQYQRFYEKVMNSFKIKQMFEDVQEPLYRLTEIHRINSEAEQERRDRNINTALVVLSLLTIVSAITDASGITSNLDWLLKPEISKIIQLTTICLVIISSLVMIIRLLSIKNKR